MASSVLRRWLLEVPAFLSRKAASLPCKCPSLIFDLALVLTSLVATRTTAGTGVSGSGLSGSYGLDSALGGACRVLVYRLNGARGDVGVSIGIVACMVGFRLANRTPLAAALSLEIGRGVGQFQSYRGGRTGSGSCCQLNIPSQNLGQWRPCRTSRQEGQHWLEATCEDRNGVKAPMRTHTGAITHSERNSIASLAASLKLEVR